MPRRAGLLALGAVAAGFSAAFVAPPAAAEVRIGLAVPLTGRMSGVGLAMQRALEAAVAEANAGGGVLGQPLTLIVADDGCARATAEGAARDLVARKPSLVIGHPCSSAAAAAATLYGTSDVLLIAVGPRHPDVTRPNAALPVPGLRLAGRDDRQGAAAAHWLLAHAPHRRVALVHDRTGYAREIADGATAALKAADVTPVAMVPIVANKPDYGEAVLRLRDSGAEAVLFAGYPEEASIILSNLRASGSAIPLLGADAMATPDFADVAARSKSLVQVLLPTTPSAGPGAGGESAYGADARGALEAWMETAGRAGSVDARALSSALRGAAIATRSLGVIRFDLNGDLDTAAFVAASAKAGQWVIDEK